MRVSRRTFLQSAVAASVVGAAVPRWMMPAGAQPLGPNEGMLLVVNLGGGLDGLSAFVPSAGDRRLAYEAGRGAEALAVNSLLPATVDHGFHPSLPRLAARFAAGNVAVVDGVGLPISLRSHTVSSAAVQSGSQSPLKTGWLGRHLDGYVDRNDELMSVAVSSTVPHHLRGAVNAAAAMPSGVGMWGANPEWRFDQTTADAVRAFAAAPIGRGPWADEVARTGATALDKAALTAGLPTSSSAPYGLARNSEIAAHIFNADIGTRVVAVSTSGYDTHAAQRSTLTQLLSLLDRSIDGFFSALSPALHNRVLVLVVSEFGRKLAHTASLGSDHGHAGLAMLIGSNVAGGLHSEPASLTTLDAQGSLIPTVDLLRVYSTVIDRWLGGDSNEVLGGTHDHLDLIAAGPGSA